MRRLLAALAVPALLVGTATPADAAFRTYRTGAQYRHVTWELTAYVGNSRGDVRIGLKARQHVTLALARANWKVTLRGGAGCGKNFSGPDVRSANQHPSVLYCRRGVRQAQADIDVERDGRGTVTVPLKVTCDPSWFTHGECGRWGYPAR